MRVLISITLLFSYAFCEGQYEKRKKRGGLVPFRLMNRPFSVGLLYQTLFALDQAFKEHGITYWINDGTLLGAIRHGGFIPWDRDADLNILHTDLKKFLGLKDWMESLGIVLREKQPGDENTIYELDVGLEKKSEMIAKALIVVVPMKYEKKRVVYEPIRRISRKASKRGYYWKKNELFPLVDYRFGPLKLKGPSVALNYLKRHYGKDCMSRIYGGIYTRGWLDRGERFEPAYYDFETGQLPVLIGIEGDPFYLKGKKMDGTRLMQIHKE